MGVIFDEVVTQVAAPPVASPQTENASEEPGQASPAELQRRQWLREHANDTRRRARLEAD